MLSIYTQNELTDSITAKENNENKIWATRVYDGNTINIVLKIPSKEKGQTTLKIGIVYLGYKKISGRFGSPGNSEECNINMACPLGNGWEPERNSVALISANGGFCSGVLVMNTCGTNIPYLLTANHCLGAGNVQNWVFQFFYFSTDCNTNTGFREDIQFNGCTVRANNADSDFALLQLNQTPAVSSGIHYAGWNRGGGAPFNVTGIHHPNHDVMKISRSTNQVIRWAGGGDNPFTHWSVSWTQGITAVGSSGSPLFDNAHRIVGQLHDGTSFCATPNAPDWYGSFDQSWTGGGTNTTRLSNWLDPNNSGAITRNTTNVSNLININGMSMSGNSTLCSGSSTPYSVSGMPAGATVTWSASPSGIVSFSCTNCLSPVLTKIGNGKITLTATVVFCGIIRIITMPVTVGIPNSANFVIYSDGPNVCPNVSVDFGAFYNDPDFCSIAQTGATNIEWNVSPSAQQIIYNSGMGVCPSVNNSGVEIIFANQGFAYQAHAKFRAQNSCGLSNWSDPYIVQIMQGGFCGGFLYSVSPNPTTGFVTVKPDISSNSKNTTENTATISAIKLFDQVGNLKKQWKFAAGSKQAQINVAELQQGIYVIEISDGKQSEKQKLIIGLQ